MRTLKRRDLIGMHVSFPINEWDGATARTVRRIESGTVVGVVGQHALVPIADRGRVVTMLVPIADLRKV